MDQYKEHLAWLDGQYAESASLLERWVNINSGTDNLSGLARMRHALREAFSDLGAKGEEIPVKPKVAVDWSGKHLEKPVGAVLRFKKRQSAPIQVVLGGHMDTVFSATSPFQKAEWLSKDRLRGPGAADMKGGLVIMLNVLKALERTPFAPKIGWEVLINADEEIGSASSEHLFMEAGRRNDIGLVFEPTFEDGALVSARKGSINFTLVSKGKSAHAGRDFYEGRNAITALARALIKVDALNEKTRGITINIGCIQGGTATNIVPDLAICRLNGRIENPHDLMELKIKLERIVHDENRVEGVHLEILFESERVPKIFDSNQEEIFEAMRSCGDLLGMDLKWRPSGGVCDGNILAGQGLPTIDTLGAVGGSIHTFEEFVLIDSLVERAKVTSLFLMKLAVGEIELSTMKARK